VSGTFQGVRALVVGFGVSGRAAAETLLEEGALVRVSEARRFDVLLAEVGEGMGPLLRRVELLAGEHVPAHLDGVDLVVASPGVPERAPILGWAFERGLPVWSELELGARLCRVPVLAVTGTNGKTTTVELIASMMRAGGLAARACGNVGFPFSMAARQPFDALAVEASSFQLRFQERFHPRVSVLLNLAPDHLDWHHSIGGYAAAKAGVFANQRDGDVHVGNRDDGWAANVSGGAPCDVRWFGWGQSQDDGTWADHERVVSVRAGRRHEFPLPAATRGRAFAMDVAAAAEAVLSFGLSPEAVATGLVSFRPLPHRGDMVAQVGGVRFVDDSKATNPHAAVASLEGRTETVLIAGGLAKGVDLTPLREGAGSLRSVVAIGQAGPDIEEVFAGVVPVRRASGIEEAVREAFREARPAGTVLLAPA
jgi:UDP-N-acetylmuramoylalanine--D-glutamate ligase